MNYVSTRGAATPVSFEDALLAGLASDGGLFVPEVWPQLDAAEIARLSQLPYAEAAAAVFAKFTGTAFSERDLGEIARDVYGRFHHPDVAPVSAFGAGDYLLELYHGPTLAFKDFAMQLLGQLFDRVLERQDRRLTIMAATSGDTGAAAIDALKHCDRVKTIVLHPEGRVTDVQRRMMTSVDQPNVLNIAVKGDFDQCQAIVKALFSDTAFVDAVSLGAVNSINWGRIAAQIVYYFTAYGQVDESGEKISFVTPTGNFGDIFAGYVAKLMGLPIDKLVIATNQNDILVRTLATGDYRAGAVTPTISPSMDIQVASNFERLLFEATGRSPAKVRAHMNAFAEGGVFTLAPAERSFIAADFLAKSASESDTAAMIAKIHDQHDRLIDPHTAVGLVAADHLKQAGALSGKVVTLSTAHPAKFPDAVEAATGKTPALPPHYADLYDRDEHFVRADASVDSIKAVILDGQS